MIDHTTEQLSKLLAKQRGEVARAGRLEFNSAIITAIETQKVVLCGFDPVLSPLLTYELIREQYQIAEIADDERSGDKVFRHLVLSSFELATKPLLQNSLLLNCASHNRHARQTFQKVAEYLDRPIINPQQLAYISRRFDKPLNLTINPDYYVESILNGGERFLSIMPLLDDDRSRQTLLQVMLGRLMIDFGWFWNAYSPVENMYFPDFFNYRDNEVFVDAGAFDGKDTLRFLRRNRYHFKAAHLFEIAPSNLQKITQTLNELDGMHIKNRIHVVASGLWSNKGQLTFRGEGLYAMLTSVPLSAKPISQPEPCQVTDLNSAIDEATLIKFEIEGAEMPALKGARAIITKFRPNMAISAYHLSDDIPDIIDFLRELDLGYRFRIRHHWGSDIRTIVYAATDFNTKSSD